MVKLLMIAPGCSSRANCEGWVSYQWVRGMSARHEVTLLTDCEPFLPESSGTRVIKLPTPDVFNRLDRFNAMFKPGHIPFFFRARRWIRSALAAGERFDLVHQVAPQALRYACPALETGLPFIIGPVGGSLDSPPEFAKEERGAPWYVRLRALDHLRLRYDPTLRATFERASCVVGMAPFVKHLLDGISIKRFVVIGDNAIESLGEPIDRSKRTGEVRLLFVGRVVRTKGVRDLIRAMRLLTDLPVVLDVLGNGHDLDACRSAASEIGISDRVRFHGYIPRSNVDEFYRSSDILVFPSYREPNGLSVIEAMGYGLPAIVCDRGGPAFSVDEKSGIRIPATNPKQFADDLARAIRELVQDRDRRLSLGEGARLRAERVGVWPVKIGEMDSLYKLIIQQNSLTGPEIRFRKERSDRQLRVSSASR
jgi:glycosyltransferase involved in cell wall biosynthesis